MSFELILGFSYLKDEVYMQCVCVAAPADN